MTEPGLKEQIEEILAIIGTSQRAMNNGKFVDLSALEKKVSVLHETIAANPSETDGMSSEDLMSFLNTIMEGVEQLDQDLRQNAETFDAEVTEKNED